LEIVHASIHHERGGAGVVVLGFIETGIGGPVEVNAGVRFEG
jgi:hypothetical protein